MNINEKIKEAKLKLLKMHYESRVGHLGGNLSCLDLMMVLHHEILKQEDVFILSKGHSCGSLYVTLNSLGVISDEELSTFHKDNTRLAGHPIGGSFPGIDWSTGSLGHGAGIACGVALAKKLQRQPGRVYCLISDGELQEGSTAESIRFGVNHNLPMTIICDNNKLQGFGRTREVVGSNIDWLPTDLLKYIQNGHGSKDIYYMLNKYKEGFQFFFAHTIKGHGITDFEDKVEGHYLPLTDEQYKTAIKDIENDFALSEKGF